jgi:hypothetical protein
MKAYRFKTKDFFLQELLLQKKAENSILTAKI